MSRMFVALLTGALVLIMPYAARAEAPQIGEVNFEDNRLFNLSSATSSSYSLSGNMFDVQMNLVQDLRGNITAYAMATSGSTQSSVVTLTGDVYVAGTGPAALDLCGGSHSHDGIRMSIVGATDAYSSGVLPIRMTIHWGHYLDVTDLDLPIPGSIGVQVMDGPVVKRKPNRLYGIRQLIVPQYSGWAADSKSVVYGDSTYFRAKGSLHEVQGSQHLRRGDGHLQRDAGLGSGWLWLG